MKEELTTAMHSEFTISEETETKHFAFAVFQLISPAVPLEKALYFMDATLEQLQPYVEEWNGFSSKQISLK